MSNTWNVDYEVGGIRFRSTDLTDEDAARDYATALEQEGGSVIDIFMSWPEREDGAPVYIACGHPVDGGCECWKIGLSDSEIAEIESEVAIAERYNQSKDN